MSQQLQIEAGKYYRSRSGAKVGPVKCIGEKKYHWAAKDGGAIRTYDLCGRWHPDAIEHAYDLIAPWDEPEQPEAESAVDPGEGWRLLEPGEIANSETDQVYIGGWQRVKGLHGKEVWEGLPRFRRRVPAPAPSERQAEQVLGVESDYPFSLREPAALRDRLRIAEHERDAHKRANAELAGENHRVKAERDQARKAIQEFGGAGKDHAEFDWGVLGKLDSLKRERDKLAEQCDANFAEVKRLKARLDEIDAGVNADAADLQKMRDGVKLNRDGLVSIIVYQRQDIAELKQANAELRERELKITQELTREKLEVIGIFAERDKLAERVKELEAKLTAIEKSHGVVLETLNKVAAHRNELQSQLAASQAKPEVQYAWRDARPEDAGKGYKCKVRDQQHADWVNVDRHPDRKLITYSKGYEPWGCSNGLCWDFCQVYAPVEATELKDEWRDLTPNEQYSGPGQVRDNLEHDWNDATIAACDNKGRQPFIAKLPDNFYTTWRFARVKRGAE